MTRIVNLRNVSNQLVTYYGQEFQPGQSINISNDIDFWNKDPEVIAGISSGILVVNDGSNDLSAIDGVKWVMGNSNPMSPLGQKIAVHPSTKPSKPNKEYYSTWVGAGDNETTGELGGGNLLQFVLQPGTPSQTIRVYFNPAFGEVYIHEGYATWTNGGLGDYISADIVAAGTQLQQNVNLDLVVDVNGWVSYAPGGPGTGTHGFASTPVLINRSFSRDGQWDYNESTGLAPNTTGTGGYKISIHEQPVHRYINKLPLFDSSYGYSRFPSNETAFLPPGYYIDLTVHNVSNGNITVSTLMEVYRESTLSS